MSASTVTVTVLATRFVLDSAFFDYVQQPQDSHVLTQNLGRQAAIPLTNAVDHLSRLQLNRLGDRRAVLICAASDGLPTGYSEVEASPAEVTASLQAPRIAVPSVGGNDRNPVASAVNTVPSSSCRFQASRI